MFRGVAKVFGTTIILRGLAKTQWHNIEIEVGYPRHMAQLWGRGGLAKTSTTSVRFRGLANTFGTTVRYRGVSQEVWHD